MRVLVTGGAGFIGSNVVAALEGLGDEVVAWDWLGSGDKWRNVAKRRRTLFVAPDHSVGEGYDAVVHMGALSAQSGTDVDAIHKTNVVLSCDLWLACARWRVPFVYASSASVYGNGAGPLTPYAWSKLLFDRWVERQTHAPPVWAGLRFTNVYGPNEYHKPEPSPVPGWYRDLQECRTPTVYYDPPREFIIDPRPMARDFVYVGDVVDVVLWCLGQTRPVGIVDVGTGKATPWALVADHVYRASFRSDGRSRRGPDLDRRPLPEKMRDRYQYETQADLTALRQAGYTGDFRSVEEGVKEYIEDYLATGDPYR